jgi:hypothetical protein
MSLEKILGETRKNKFYKNIYKQLCRFFLMKRGAVIFALVFLVILFSPMIFADELSQVQKAYNCLEGKINSSKCSSLTFEEKVFSLLATGKCKSEVIADNLSNQCWPKSGCTIKSTAQAMLALDEEVNLTSAENWLLSKTSVPSDIDWFLEIESSSSALCSIIYDSTTYSLKILENKTLSSSNLGSCLSLAQDNYWIRISPTCYNKEIRVSCNTGVANVNFMTTLLFKKKDSLTVHVSNVANSAASGSTTRETVDSFCFSDGTGCNYEGSLWATFVLYSLTHNSSKISKFMPYLITGISDNSKYLPESFLYSLTGKFGTELLLKQQGQLYWDASGNKYYDTALALYPFRFESPFEKGYSKEWLLRVQEESGCWNGGNLRDTAFILYSIWTKGPSPLGTCLFASNCIKYDCQVASCINGVCLYDSSIECKDGDSCCNPSCTYATDDDCEIGENECTSDEDCDYLDTLSDEYCSSTDLTKVYQDVIDYSCKNRICTKTETKKVIETCTNDEECDYGYCSEKIVQPCDGYWDCPSGQDCSEQGECFTPGTSDCEANDYFCVLSSKCADENLAGEEYSCSETGNFVCCTDEPLVGTCVSQGGNICDSHKGESCPLSGGTVRDASDTAVGEICCIGAECQSSSTACTPDCSSEETCVDGTCVKNIDYTCKTPKGICKSTCGIKEKVTHDYTCESGKSCCASKGGVMWWIWILIVLILLAIFGIVFKDKLRPFWFKLKSNFGGGKKEKPGNKVTMPLTSVSPSLNPQTRMMPRRILPSPARPPMRRPAPIHRPQIKKPEEPKKGELDDVLKKLKEMGK